MSGEEVDLRRYLLSEQESRRILIEDIVPAEMAGSKRAQEPVALFIAGQPGASTTRTTSDAVSSFGATGEGVVVVNSDTYKPYHPRWAELMSTDETTAALYTRLDGRRWMDQAYTWSAEHARHVIVETTMQSAEVFEEPVTSFAA